MKKSHDKDLMFLILQFLKEEEFKESVQTFEKESGIYFNMNYFDDLVLGGQFDEAEQYLSGFTKLNDNLNSRKIYFEIRKKKYLEALDNHDRAKAIKIFDKELKVFASDDNEDLFNEIILLLSLDNFRENEHLSNYGDIETGRKLLMVALKKLLNANPLLRGKLQFPDIMKARLKLLMSQSLYLQHSLCASPSQNPDLNTVLVDHSCGNSTYPNTQLATSSRPVVSAQNIEGSIPLSANGALKPTSTPVQNPLNSRLATPSSMSHPLLLPPHETYFGSASRPALDTPARNRDIEMGDVIRPRPNEVNPAAITPKVIEIRAPTQFRSMKLPANVEADKILRLSYTRLAKGILALQSKGTILQWSWLQDVVNGKATTKVSPQLKVPASGMQLTNDVTKGSPKDNAVHCFALSANGCYVMSASGGKISLFNLSASKVMKTFLAPPPMATYIAFYPQDNNIVAIGMDNSTIYIYNARVDKVIAKLKGHSKRITGLAFSSHLNLLVSSGADAQMIEWECDNWERQGSCFLQTLATGRSSDTGIQFHPDQIHLLAMNQTQLALYDMNKQGRKLQWAAAEANSAPISHATFSCDGQLVYSSFLDGTVRIFGFSNFQIQCQINPTAYLPSDIVSSSNAYPLVVAANPKVPNQFAMGLADGSVYICEPLESVGKWDET